MAHLPVHAVVRVVIDLPYDEGRLLRLDLVPKELKLLHQLVHIDLAIPLLIHPLERAPQALQLLRLLELSSLTLSPLLLIVRLCTATRACEKADKASRIARTLRTSALALFRSLADDMVSRSRLAASPRAGQTGEKPTAKAGGRNSRDKKAQGGEMRRTRDDPRAAPPPPTNQPTKSPQPDGSFSVCPVADSQH